MSIVVGTTFKDVVNAMIIVDGSVAADPVVIQMIVLDLVLRGGVVDKPELLLCILILIPLTMTITKVNGVRLIQNVMVKVHHPLKMWVDMDTVTMVLSHFYRRYKLVLVHVLVARMEWWMDRNRVSTAVAVFVHVAEMDRRVTLTMTVYQRNVMLKNISVVILRPLNYATTVSLI
tara:strand:- start:37 stop:561 length:525 start_codon:yes stop_codon:yes gene_type:complete